jgi:hypothetical protein
MFLEPVEISTLTGRKLKRLQIEALRKMGIPFFINAIGHPVVARAAVDGTRGPAPEPRKAWSPKVLGAR